MQLSATATVHWAFNVCKHRAHQGGEGQTTRIMCPITRGFMVWTGNWYARRTRKHWLISMFKTCALMMFRSKNSVALSLLILILSAQLAKQSVDLETEIRHWAPDIEDLTFGHRLTYDIKSNWKNVVDNFLECYHCPTAHKDLHLVDMDTYKVTTHGIYSSHMADAGKDSNSAYDVSNATENPYRVVVMADNLFDALSGPILNDCVEHHSRGARSHIRNL